jgi:hypothetical protein
MRLSDIFKKAQQQAPAPEAKKEAPPPVVPSPVRENTKPAPQPETPPSSQAPHASAAEAVYGKAVTEIKNIIGRAQKGEPFPDPVTAPAAIVDLIEQRDEDILFLADKATPDIYLYGHSVNVCILAAVLGQSAGMNKYRLADLALCAFLHDVGMAGSLSAVLKNGKLTEAELSQVRKHPQQSREIVRAMEGLSAETRALLDEVIAQIHERNDASGYPSGLLSEDIHEFSRIIAIADVYEAMTHPRSYRDRYLPHETLKLMITSVESKFDAALLKAFIERISLFPPGSYVRLNTDDIARVIGVNRSLPTRPRVRVLVDASRQKVQQPKVIDLAVTPMIFVKEAVDETKLSLPDKRLALELKAVRWWVKGL